MCLCLTKVLLWTPYPNFRNSTDRSEVFSKLLQALLAPRGAGWAVVASVSSSHLLSLHPQKGMDIIWDTWVGSIDVCERLDRSGIKHVNWQFLIIVWVLCISGAEGYMFGKKNWSKHRLWGIWALCTGLCACGSLLGRFCGDVHQQSVVSGLFSGFCQFSVSIS